MMWQDESMERNSYMSLQNKAQRSASSQRFFYSNILLSAHQKVDEQRQVSSNSASSQVFQSNDLHLSHFLSLFFFSSHRRHDTRTKINQIRYRCVYDEVNRTRIYFIPACLHDCHWHLPSAGLIHRRVTFEQMQATLSWLIFSDPITNICSNESSNSVCIATKMKMKVQRRRQEDRRQPIAPHFIPKRTASTDRNIVALTGLTREHTQFISLQSALQERSVNQ